MKRLDNLEQRVNAFMGQLELGDAYRENGVSVIRSSDATLLVSCFSQDDSTWCRISAIMLLDLEPTLEVLHRILQLNNDVLMGGLRLFQDRTLVFSTTLQGDTLDGDSFAQALRYAAHVATVQGSLLRSLTHAQSGADLLQEAPPCG